MENTEKLQTNKKRWFETEKMQNGEKRWRFKINENLIFSTTTTHKKYGWQSPHYHIKATEKYFVIKGNILIVMYENKKTIVKKLFPGDRLTIKPYTHHNVYVNKNTFFYVFKKSPEPLFKDWYNANELNYVQKNTSKKIADISKKLKKLKKIAIDKDI